MISDDQLRRIMTRLPAAKRESFLPHLNQALRSHGIGTMKRTAAFIAQIAHESGEFRYMQELWGPTDAQRRYEPVTTLSKKLGNTQPGDGKRFMGRGPIQITGRDNYVRYGQELSLDLTAQPELAATPAVAFSIAGLFWRRNGLNELADQDEFVKITKKINGGTNGLVDRQKYHALALQVLSNGFVEDAPAPLPRGARAAAADEAPLPRGHEAIARDTARAQREAPDTAPKTTRAPKAPAAKKAAAKRVVKQAAKPTTRPAAKRAAAKAPPRGEARPR